MISETLSLAQASHCNLWSSRLCEKCHRIRVSWNFTQYLTSKRKIRIWSNIQKACFTFATEVSTVVLSSKTSTTRFQFEKYQKSVFWRNTRKNAGYLIEKLTPKIVWQSYRAVLSKSVINIKPSWTACFQICSDWKNTISSRTVKVDIRIIVISSHSNAWSINHVGWPLTTKLNQHKQIYTKY